MEFKPVMFSNETESFNHLVQWQDTGTEKLTLNSTWITTTERLLTHFQWKKVTALTALEDVLMSQTALNVHENKQTNTHTKRSIKLSFNTPLLEDPGSSKYETWALCGVNMCMRECVCLCGCVCVCLSVCVCAHPTDHEILCLLYLCLMLSPSYLLIIELVSSFVQNINQGATEAVISMGKEDSSTEEDSAEKQVRWFYSLSLSGHNRLQRIVRGSMFMDYLSGCEYWKSVFVSFLSCKAQASPNLTWLMSVIYTLAPVIDHTILKMQIHNASLTSETLSTILC